MLLENLHLAKGLGGTNEPVAIATALRDRLSKEGVDLDPVKNPGKAIFYNDRQGMLIVRATLQDLDLIEAELAVMNTAPPQINIKCKFVEVPQDDPKATGLRLVSGQYVDNKRRDWRTNSVPPPHPSPPVRATSLRAPP